MTCFSWVMKAQFICLLIFAAINAITSLPSYLTRMEPDAASLMISQLQEPDLFALYNANKDTQQWLMNTINFTNFTEAWYTNICSKALYERHDDFVVGLLETTGAT